MARYAILVAYKGTGYAGWQIQPGDRTIQGELYHAIQTFLRREIHIAGAGRTDAGVHAAGQIAHFDYDGEINPDKFLRSMYGLLPHDIAVNSILKVNDTFHARFSAVSRTYRYTIIRQPDPFLRETSWYLPRVINFDKVRECWEMLPGEHDFSNFARRDPLITNYRCTVLDAGTESTGSGIFLSITANRFLRSMVRLLTGAAVNAGCGKLRTDYFREALNNPGFELQGFVAPASGLVLQNVRYQNNGKMNF
jgi:tRNA pseudouridine38-40 synthase